MVPLLLTFYFISKCFLTLLFNISQFVFPLNSLFSSPSGNWHFWGEFTVLKPGYRHLRLWFKFVFKKRFNQLILIFTVKWILRNQKSSKSLNSRSTRSSFLMSRVLLQGITSFLSEWTIEWLLQVSLATSPRFHTLKRCDLPCFRSIPNFQLSIIHLWIDNNLKGRSIQ